MVKQICHDSTCSATNKTCGLASYKHIR